MSEGLVPQGDNFWGFAQWAGSVFVGAVIVLAGGWQWATRQLWAIDILRQNQKDRHEANEKEHEKLWQVVALHKNDLDHFREVVVTKADMANMEQRIFNKIELVVEVLRHRSREE